MCTNYLSLLHIISSILLLLYTQMVYSARSHSDTANTSASPTLTMYTLRARNCIMHLCTLQQKAVSTFVRNTLVLCVVLYVQCCAM